MISKRRVLAVTALTAATLALTACGSGANVAAGSGSGTGSAVGSSSASDSAPASSSAVFTPVGPATPTTAPASSGGSASTASSGPASPAECTQAQLTATTGQSSSGAGQHQLALVFTNHSSSACWVSGYPGVAGLNASGQQVQQATRRAGVTPGTITLAAGASVSAIVSDSNPDNYSPGQCIASFGGGLAVTPPNTSTTVHLTDKADQLSGCNFQINPVVSGTTGGGVVG